VQAKILSTVNILFDASSVIYLILWGLHDALSVTKRTLFFGYAALAALVFTPLAALWRRNEKTFAAVKVPLLLCCTTAPTLTRLLTTFAPPSRTRPRLRMPTCRSGSGL
jgi:hypothetical protein